MSGAKFTPGPWSAGHMVNAEHACGCRYILAEQYFGSVATISEDNGLVVGEGGNDSPPEPEAIANAHLIASAPELYEALKAARNELKCWRPENTQVIEFADAALAKAEGWK